MSTIQMVNGARVCRLGVVLPIAALLLLGGAACSDDDGDESADDTTETSADSSSTSTEEMPAGETVEVTAEDYKFVGLPESVDVGTQLTLVNDSQSELHELVAMRIPDDETRSIEELVQLPEDQLDAVFGDAMPEMVLVRAPGDAELITALGDGTFSEAARYAIFCAIPVGADPAAMMAAMQEESDGPPTTAAGDGPPHFTQGMYAEVTVEE